MTVKSIIVNDPGGAPNPAWERAWAILEIALDPAATRTSLVALAKATELSYRSIEHIGKANDIDRLNGEARADREAAAAQLAAAHEDADGLLLDAKSKIANRHVELDSEAKRLTVCEADVKDREDQCKKREGKVRQAENKVANDMELAEAKLAEAKETQAAAEALRARLAAAAKT